jgi:hypothetical protein
VWLGQTKQEMIDVFRIALGVNLQALGENKYELV